VAVTRPEALRGTGNGRLVGGMPAPPTDPEWRTTAEPVAYPEALAAMEARVEAVRAGRAPELVWLLQHPPLYTAGTSADPAELLMPERFPVYAAGRGGRYTYHGPGQRVVYLVLDLKRREPDLRRYVWRLEEWVIRSLAALGVQASRRAGRIGLWVVKPGGPEAKIGAIGVRVRHWVSFHGVSVNVSPDLGHFDGIVPCGIAEHGVTSLADLGVAASMADLDLALRASFHAVFETGPA
jgi:lipoyl(octanoyl) transferase